MPECHSVRRTHLEPPILLEFLWNWRRRVTGFTERIAACVKSTANLVRPDVHPEFHRIAVVQSIIKQHHRWPIASQKTRETVPQSPIDVHVTKAITSNQNRICFVHMPDQRRMK